MFDMKKFDEAKFVPRTEEVPVPELTNFFDEDSKCVFVVRNLTGIEVARARSAQTANRSLETLINGLLSDRDDEKVNALKETLGIATESVPDDHAYRVACLKMGSVDPEMDEGQAVRLAEVHGIVFYKLTNKIIQLTGMGMILGE